MKNSPPPSSYSNSTLATISKPHSLNISTGPRPLHLVDGNSNFQPQGPATAPLATHVQTSLYSPSPVSETSTPPSSANNINGFHHKPRRQSSISYNPRGGDTDRDATVRLPLSTRHALVRSSSLGPKSPHSAVKIGDRRSAGSTPNPELSDATDRPPLTLAEKHAELLHFIAQKESKCLELRSQLAMHEAELLQLKRKWEKIVCRGFDKSNAGNDRVTNTSANGQGGAMLEGIKEGVQGVSRFIAAGLAIGELPSPSSYQSQTTRPVRPSHLTNQSNSSVSTYTTKSTRLSQSSASSIGEDLTTSTPEKDGEVLMVHDTGATPTMSPNPAFMHQQQQQQNQVHESPRSSLDAEDDFFSANIGVAKAHRRKSQDAPILESPRTSPVSPTSSFPAESSSVKQTARGKRMSINGLPPVSSIPGLGSLTAGATSQPVSSWVGSVGKKWEELQRGSTFSKSQKRASLLISDVSQSIAYALAPPPSSSTTSALSPFPTPPPSLSTAALNDTPLPPSSSSLLDDDHEAPTHGLAHVMTPDSRPIARPDPRSSILSPTTSSKAPVSTFNGRAPQSQTTIQLQDDDDEWNW